MLLTYRPELDNPPMAPEATLGFSFLQEGTQEPKHYTVDAGVNRNFPEDVWARIRDYEVVQRLLSLGALSVDEDSDFVESATPVVESADTLTNMPLPKAMALIEASFDTEQLKRWDAKEQRIRAKNAIAKRIEAITEGNG